MVFCGLPPKKCVSPTGTAFGESAMLALSLCQEPPMYLGKTLFSHLLNLQWKLERA